ncbi:hypothetical protein [Roseicella aquatilis]|nr:hypothetical protein [Roseicella aquatilis]
MTAVLVDSNVLLDLLTEEGRWIDWSAKAIGDFLAEAIRAG